MTEHKEHKEHSENKEHAEHSGHKHNFFTKPIILVAVIGVVVIIAIVAAIMIFAGKTSLPSCTDVQGTCRASCYSDEVKFINGKCDSSYMSCCIKTNAGTTTPTTPTEPTAPTTPEEEPEPTITGCFDSDGNNAEVLGYVQDKEGFKHGDICQDSYNVIEATCDLTGDPKYTKINCAYGCKNGACQPKEKTCFDSDYDNTFTKGYVTDLSGVTKYDVCKNSQTVTEYTCNSYGSATSRDVYCKTGCVNGKCNAE